MSYEDACAQLVESVRAVLADREALAAEIRERGKPDLTQWAPGGAEHLTRRSGGRRSWFNVHPARVWYAEGGHGGTAASWSVERTDELTDRLALLVGRLALYRPIADFMQLNWRDVVREAASERNDPARPVPP